MGEDERATQKMGRIKLEDDATGEAKPDLEEIALSRSSEAEETGSRSPSTSTDGVRLRSDGADLKPARLSRKSSQKPQGQMPLLFDSLPDATPESCKHFQVISDCLYGSKNLGSTDGDAFDCDCRDEFHNGQNFACGEDSDCINRATKVECAAGSGNCSGGCQNQRFQRKQFADVSVIKTEKKGFGLRSNSALQPNDFVFEYIGEVIGEPAFRRRMLQYDQEGIRHFYFMSLNKSEFVDATRKGNLGRFCNHSCNPNCYVDKWVVGEKLRMGIFALRAIQPGEELVFNYNVDRYGADPQPCYCGEPNCVGFIGGKTQTGRATKLPVAVVEALGIDSADGWDTAVAKKPRKKKADESDEDYVDSIQARPLDEDDSRKVMAALMQCKEKWIAVKLLERIQTCDNEKVIYHVMRMHAYSILKTTLNTFIEDHNVVVQVLSILESFPRMTKNKIQDSKIEATVENLANSEQENIANMSRHLLEEWSKLEVGFRIKRRKIDPNAPKLDTREERRGGSGGLPREDGAKDSPAKVASPTIDAPKGPRNNAPQRGNAYFINRPRRPFFAPLPEGWLTARDAGGNTYFYDKQGNTTWKRPTQPAQDPLQKQPSKALQEQALIQSIINKVTKEGPPKSATPRASAQPSESQSPIRDTKKDKWRDLSIDKQMKIYENTIFPPVKHILDKFRHKLPKDDLKRLGKDIAKKLVASDYKNNRVEDPGAKLSEKQILKIKKFVKDFLERAVQKYADQQRRRNAKTGQQDKNAARSEALDDDTPEDSPIVKNGAETEADQEDVTISDVDEIETPSGFDRKRKRIDFVDSENATPSEGPEVKRTRDEETADSTPPPPPPPPESSMEDAVSEERKELREQEEALMRENEEAQRLEDEAAKTKEMEQAAQHMQQELSALA